MAENAYLALRGALIGLVQAAEDRDRTYQPRRASVPARGWIGECLAEALVWARPVEVGDVLPQHVVEAGLAEDEQVV